MLGPAVVAISDDPSEFAVAAGAAEAGSEVLSIAAVAMRPRSTCEGCDGSCGASLGLLVGYAARTAAGLGDISLLFTASLLGTESLAMMLLRLLGLWAICRFASAASPVNFVCGAKLGSFAPGFAVNFWIITGDMGGVCVEGVALLAVLLVISGDKPKVASVAVCAVSRLVPLGVGIAADENCGDSIIMLLCLEWYLS